MVVQKLPAERKSAPHCGLPVCKYPHSSLRLQVLNPQIRSKFGMCALHTYTHVIGRLREYPTAQCRPRFPALDFPQQGAKPNLCTLQCLCCARRRAPNKGYNPVHMAPGARRQTGGGRQKFLACFYLQCAPFQVPEPNINFDSWLPNMRPSRAAPQHPATVSASLARVNIALRPNPGVLDARDCGGGGCCACVNAASPSSAIRSRAAREVPARAR